MSLELNFKICQPNCKEITFYDLTGDGLNGYGGDNPSISDFTSAVLNITLPNSTTIVSLDIFQLDGEETPFPTIDITDSYTINSQILNSTNTSENLDDGLYTFEYLLYDSETDTYYRKVKEILLFCQVECCVKKLPLKFVDNCCSGCKQEYVDKFLLGFTLLETLKSLGNGCGNSVSISKTLKTLQNLCSNSECGCG